MSDAFDDLRRVIGERMCELEEELRTNPGPKTQQRVDVLRAEIKKIWYRFLKVDVPLHKGGNRR